jgi:hypothetical protein
MWTWVFTCEESGIVRDKIGDYEMARRLSLLRVAQVLRIEKLTTRSKHGNCARWIVGLPVLSPFCFEQG